MRDRQELKNEIPVVLINPSPNTPIHSGDKLLIMGIPNYKTTESSELDINEENLLLNNHTRRTSINLSSTSFPTSDELLLLAK